MLSYGEHRSVVELTFPPPVGESPVLSKASILYLLGFMFPPPVGESPVLRFIKDSDEYDYYVSTPCRGITCAEEFDAEEDDEKEVSTPCRGITCAEPCRSSSRRERQLRFPPPVGESPVLRSLKAVQ